MKFRYKGASVTLIDQGDDVHTVGDLWSKERGKGHARRLMNKVISYADRHGLTLVLLTSVYGPKDKKKLTEKQLLAFYRSLGFKGSGDSFVVLFRQPKN